MFHQIDFCRFHQFLSRSLIRFHRCVFLITLFSFVFFRKCCFFCIFLFLNLGGPFQCCCYCFHYNVFEYYSVCLYQDKSFVMNIHICTRNLKYLLFSFVFFFGVCLVSLVVIVNVENSIYFTPENIKN